MKYRLLIVPTVTLTAGLLLSACGPAAILSPALTVVVRDGSYAPAALEAYVGKPIRLTLENQDEVPHQLAIEEIALATQGSSAGSMAGMAHAMPGDATAMPSLHIVRRARKQRGRWSSRPLRPGSIPSAAWSRGIQRPERSP